MPLTTNPTTATTNYVFFSDAGHGWLRVPMAELRTLGIADSISPYSYREGGDAYLEEDCDLARFAKAKNWSQLPDNVPHVQHDESPIREFSRYTA